MSQVSLTCAVGSESAAYARCFSRPGAVNSKVALELTDKYKYEVQQKDWFTMRHSVRLQANRSDVPRPLRRRHRRSMGARRARTLLPIILGALLVACATNRAVDQSIGHVFDESPPVEPTLPLAKAPPPLADPEPVAPVPTYTVVVKDVPVADLLFSLARDAELELDLQADSEARITMNAVDQPLPAILERISAQSELRYQLSGANLHILKDEPYWQSYLVDYVNISRSAVGQVGVATQIAATGGTVDDEQAAGNQGDEQGNISKTTVSSISDNDFWAAIEQSLAAIVGEDFVGAGSGSGLDGSPIIVNRMAGIVTVNAKQSGHQQIQRYLDQVAANSQRQVLIEMTIVEVLLNDKFQAGVDWQRLSDDFGAGSNGLSFESDFLGANLSTSPFVSLSFNSFDEDGSGFSSVVRMLQQFGDTKVLSSPKLMALNNQTALLKVVNEEVYFTIELDIREATADIPERRTFTSEIHTVPVGLVLSVTPQISEKGYVSLNIRPTISRITGFAIDPAPRLASAEFDNLIPEIQIREIESLLQVLDRRTVVLGGLMQNEIIRKQDGIPGLARIPKVGGLFSYTSDELVKSELVIFLRPSIVNGGVGLHSQPRVQDFYPQEVESGPD